DADLIVRSADNVIFHLHKKNLECAADGFPPSNTPTNGEIVSLAESGAVLEILFGFIYPRPLPHLEELELKDLLLVAEAAEKYGLFNAIYACQLCLGKFTDSHTEDILRFASKHHCSSLILQLPLNFVIDTPLSKVVDILPSHMYKNWVRI
ncbi:hypothetical protein C8J55DRAFT_435362, partial [Lentinula edodes]